MFSKIIVSQFIIFLFLSCQQNVYVKKSIDVDLQSDLNCYFLIEKETDTIKVTRAFRILENTLSDTIILGFGVLPPKYIGSFKYTKLENRSDVLLDLDYSNPPTDRICIDRYKEKNSQGLLVFELIKVGD